jgi:hypothetical protein
MVNAIQSQRTEFFNAVCNFDTCKIIRLANELGTDIVNAPEILPSEIMDKRGISWSKNMKGPAVFHVLAAASIRLEKGMDKSKRMQEERVVKKALECLKKLGADFHRLDTEGSNVFHWAILNSVDSKPNVFVIKTLIKLGARNFLWRDDSNKYPIFYAENCLDEINNLFAKAFPGYLHYLPSKYENATHLEADPLNLVRLSLVAVINTAQDFRAVCFPLKDRRDKATMDASLLLAASLALATRKEEIIEEILTAHRCNKEMGMVMSVSAVITCNLKVIKSLLERGISFKSIQKGLEKIEKSEDSEKGKCEIEGLIWHYLVAIGGYDIAKLVIDQCKDLEEKNQYGLTIQELLQPKQNAASRAFWKLQLAQLHKVWNERGMLGLLNCKESLLTILKERDAGRIGSNEYLEALKQCKQEFMGNQKLMGMLAQWKATRFNKDTNEFNIGLLNDYEKLLKDLQDLLEGGTEEHRKILALIEAKQQAAVENDEDSSRDSD